MGGSFIAEILCRLIPALNLEMSVALFASAQKRVCALTNGNFERRRRQPQLYIYGYIDKNYSRRCLRVLQTSNNKGLFRLRKGNKKIRVTLEESIKLSKLIGRLREE